MKLVATVTAALVLAGCVHAPAPDHPVAGTGSVSTAAGNPTALPALAPPSAVSPRSASQVIHATYGTRNVTLRTAIEIDASRVSLVGVTATGQRLFTASYDGQAVTADASAFVPKEISPERVLADMQLALWPLDAVRAVRHDGEVTEPWPGLRRLTRDGKLAAEVHYASADPWGGRLWFVSFEYGYSLTIDTARE